MTTDYIAEHDGPTLAERRWFHQEEAMTDLRISNIGHAGQPFQYGDYLRCGYEPYDSAAPLRGAHVAVTCRKVETTVSMGEDDPVDGIIGTDQYPVRTGLKTSQWTDVSTMGFGNWQGGGAELLVQLIDSAGVILDSQTVLVAP